MFGPSPDEFEYQGQGHEEQKLHFFGPFGSLRAVYVWLNIFSLCLKPNSITLASSELAPNMFGASSELASLMEFGFYFYFAKTTFEI